MEFAERHEADGDNMDKHSGRTWYKMADTSMIEHCLNTCYPKQYKWAKNKEGLDEEYPVFRMTLNPADRREISFMSSWTEVVLPGGHSLDPSTSHYARKNRKDHKIDRLQGNASSWSHHLPIPIGEQKTVYRPQAGLCCPAQWNMPKFGLGWVPTAENKRLAINPLDELSRHTVFNIHKWTGDYGMPQNCEDRTTDISAWSPKVIHTVLGKKETTHMMQWLDTRECKIRTAIDTLDVDENESTPAEIVSSACASVRQDMTAEDKSKEIRQATAIEKIERTKAAAAAADDNAMAGLMDDSGADTVMISSEAASSSTARPMPQPPRPMTLDPTMPPPPVVKAPARMPGS
jgi:hypothetical protein